MKQKPSLPRPVKLLISIVNWNGPDHTLNCLRALNAVLVEDAHLYHVRVVVIDNYSQDLSVAQIRDQWPAVEIIEARQNLGYAAGHLLSLPVAREWQADAMCLLNNDAVVESNTIRELVLAWRNNGDAIFAGLEYFLDADGQRLFHFPARFLRPPYPIHTLWRTRHLWREPPAKGVGALPVGAVLGGLLLLPMGVIDQLNWLSERWFMYGEELDYAFTYRAQGGRCFLVTTAQLLHQGSGSTASDPVLGDLMCYYRTRNDIALSQKYSNKTMQLAVLLKKCAHALLLMPIKFRRAGWMICGVRDARRRRMGKTWAPEFFQSTSSAVQHYRIGALRKTASRLHLLGHRLMEKLQALAAQRRITEVSTGAGSVRFDKNHPLHTRAYYLYCVELFRAVMQESNSALHLAFAIDATTQPLNPPVLRVAFQIEHTLVKPGGRDTQGALPSNTPLPNGRGYYLTRIENLAELELNDCVIEYSSSNFKHLSDSRQVDALLAKTCLISPLIYPLEEVAERFANIDLRLRPFQCITQFYNAREGRRARFLQDARHSGLRIANIRGVYDANRVQALFERTAVLVNVHQTEEHDTLEELRILPALLCGVLVVSEDGPLRDTLPYADYVIWSSLDDLPKTLRAVMADLPAQQKKTFGDPRLMQILQSMAANNRTRVQRAVQCLLRGNVDQRETVAARYSC